MTNAQIKDLLDWFIPKKVKTLLLKYGERAQNYFRNDQSLFKKNIALKNIEENQRCFILGNGSSINKQDLKLLSGETSIAVAGFFTHELIHIIQPKYYVVNSIFGLHKAVLEEDKFINWLRAMDETLIDSTIMFMDAGDKPYIDKYNLFRNKDIYWYQMEYYDGGRISDIDLAHLEKGASVSELAISIALYLGFKKNYLLGYDHNWFEGGDYFNNKRYNKYFETTKSKIFKRLKLDSLYHMQIHARIFIKYKQLQKVRNNIYNANANKDSYVDVFPKVDFHQLFKH